MSEPETDQARLVRLLEESHQLAGQVGDVLPAGVRFAVDDLREQLYAELVRQQSRPAGDAVERVIRAVLVEGPYRPAHHAALDDLSRRWPALAGALAELLRAHGRPVPPAWRGLR